MHIYIYDRCIYLSISVSPSLSIYRAPYIYIHIHRHTYRYRRTYRGPLQAARRALLCKLIEINIHKQFNT